MVRRTIPAAPEPTPMAMRPRRSVLYVPGDNERAIDKAKTLAADSIILDLEDSVAPANKELARKQTVAAIHAGEFGSHEVILRVNPIETPWGMADLQAAIDAEPHAREMLAKLSAQNRFALAFRTHNMKTEAGRKKKIESLVEMLKRGETIYPQGKK